jgi:hypothetical protein
VEHSREIYNILDLVGDLGGVLEVLLTLFGIFMFRISERSFVLKALEKLFLAHTVQTNIFVKKAQSKNKKFKGLKVPTPEEYKNKVIEDHVKQDYPIKLSSSNKLKLILNRIVPCLNLFNSE